MKTALLLASLLAPVGCGPYVLRGKVVSGGVSSVTVVQADDPRLDNFGLGDATLRLTLEPDSLAREHFATEHVTADGSFAIPIDRFGAGWMEYEFGLVARCADHNSAVHTFRLPGRGKRLYITLATGPDRYREPDDPLREARPYLKDR